MRSVVESKHCYGCSGCEHICPTQAISLHQNQMGFYKSKIDQEKCIDCQACRNVCPVLKTDDFNDEIKPKVFAVKSKDSLIRQESQSGGAFYTLAYQHILDGGYVSGVVKTHEQLAQHIITNNLNELGQFQKSKYIQSHIGDVYKNIFDLLKDGKKVLFSGTPCQVAGLNMFLGNRVDKSLLLTIDIICHGIPSPMIWNDVLGVYKQRYAEDIININFRDKSNGWHSHKETIYTTSHEYSEDMFTTLFYNHLIMNDCCEYCSYSNLKRVSDITIGDFWGIEKISPDFDDNKGISLIITNTEKGNAMFLKSRNEFLVEQHSIEECMQRPLMVPYHKSFFYDAFWYSYKKEGINKAFQRYCTKNKWQTLFLNINQMIKAKVYGEK